MNHSKPKTAWVYFFYAALIAVVCVLLLFTNINYDAEYQFAMAYRMAKGDALITQMWEPHQTSAFLCALLVKLYMTLTHTTTGIVLFVQFVSLLVRAGISLCLYKTLRQRTDTTSPTPLLAAVIYLLHAPNSLLIPDFSNMLLWSGTLLFLSLANYYETKKPWLLVLSAVFLCIGVLSYPSFACACIAVLFLLLRYSQSARRDILIFTCVCALIGGSFAGYLLLHIGWDKLLTCILHALALEPSHTVSLTDKVLAYLPGLAQILGVLACAAAAAAVTELLVRRKKAVSFSKDRWLLLLGCFLLMLLLISTLRVKNDGAPSYFLLLLVLLGFSKRSLLSITERRVYDIGFQLGIAGLLATLLISDHGILQSIPYMQLSVCVSTLPLCRWFAECSGTPLNRKLFLFAVHAFLILTACRCIYIHLPIHGRSQIYSLSSRLGLIRSGPAAAILTDHTGAAMQNISIKEWEEYIRPGDTIWILGDPVDTLGYLYEDVEVGAPSVMSTPTYNEALLLYWEINPEKYPDVIIVSGYDGTITWSVLQNAWLMDWLQNEYCAETVIDGVFWKYYFKESR